MLDFKAAHDIAAADLAPTHPIRLGLALNFSVFCYEILNQSDKACGMAKQDVGRLICDGGQAFEEAIAVGGRIIRGQHAHNATAQGQPNSLDFRRPGPIGRGVKYGVWQVGEPYS